MSICSMTGFGRGEAVSGGVSVVVELSSVNRRQFDCRVALPRELGALEARVTALLKAGVRRGQVYCGVALSRASPRAGGLRVDMARAREQVAVLREASEALGLRDDLSASALFSLPGVLSSDAEEVDPGEAWPVVEEAVSAALGQLRAMRLREGGALAADLLSRLAGLSALRAAVEARAEISPAEFRDKLSSRLERLAAGAGADPVILERELVAYADRSDVSEELTRIASHLEQAGRLLRGEDGSAGRPLDFLCQELLREINTIGSKCCDAEISCAVVSFKALLETMREQVQNIE